MIVQKCHFLYFYNHNCLTHSVLVNPIASGQNSGHGGRVNAVLVFKEEKKKKTTKKPTTLMLLKD